VADLAEDQQNQQHQPEYRRLNRANWDERATVHAASPDYALDRFVADPGFLSQVVRFDVPRLGDVAGLRAVHLQCHIGTDTISLYRLGARITGLDFSPAALEQARSLAARAGAAVEFVEADVYDAPRVLEPGTFDLVYTGIGALCWLPEVRRWAGVVAALLRPGGRLFIRECHPMLQALDIGREDRTLVLIDPYFELPEPVVWDDPGTYVTTEARIANSVTHAWNHGIGEVVSAVLDAGLEVTGLAEHDSAPWEALPGLMARDERGEWRLTERPWRLASTYTLTARKRG
jgi:SAM-dependent methyltransferase